MNLNKVILAGNLTRDPEMRATAGGASVCKFSLAINRTFTPKGGDKQEETTYVDVVAFGRQAETLNKYMAKGRPLFVEGRLKTESWEDRETGQKRSKLGVVLESFQFMGGREEGQGVAAHGRATNPVAAHETENMSNKPATPPSQHEMPGMAARPKTGYGDADVDEDVPF